MKSIYFYSLANARWFFKGVSRPDERGGRVEGGERTHIESGNDFTIVKGGTLT